MPRRRKKSKEKKQKKLEGGGVSVGLKDGEEVRTLEDVAQRIRDGRAKNILFLSGAGISVNAGIPDFRTPGTGLYYSLEKYKLPRPEAIFDLDYFRKKTPRPFFLLARELLPGSRVPTRTHAFLKLLTDRKLLLRTWTQNIDGLERVAGVPSDRIVEAHGSFATASCVECKKQYPIADMRKDIKASRIPKCSCGGVPKPDIVFFGEDLPKRFYALQNEDFKRCDLLIVAGTSLQVSPFCNLHRKVGGRVPRLLINRDIVGEDGYNGFRFSAKKGCRDVASLGDCDATVTKLVEILGWTKELDAIEAKLKAKHEADAKARCHPADSPLSALKGPEKASDECVAAGAKETDGSTDRDNDNFIILDQEVKGCLTQLSISPTRNRIPSSINDDDDDDDNDIFRTIDETEISETTSDLARIELDRGLEALDCSFGCGPSVDVEGGLEEIVRNIVRVANNSVRGYYEDSMSSIRVEYGTRVLKLKQQQRRLKRSFLRCFFRIAERRFRLGIFARAWQLWVREVSLQRVRKHAMPRIENFVQTKQSEYRLATAFAKWSRFHRAACTRKSHETLRRVGERWTHLQSARAFCKWKFFWVADVSTRLREVGISKILWDVRQTDVVKGGTLRTEFASV
eukprot:g1208.t1